MARHFQPYCPEQPTLLPIDPREWLPEDSLAYQVRDIVGELDFALLYSAYSRDGRGAPAFSPQMMIAVLLYAHYKGVSSSRGIKRLCLEDLGARYLCAGTVPDHRSLSVFRKRHGAALRDLFQQSILLCKAAGMVSLKQVSVDGSKFSGAASKDSSLTYANIVQSEAELSAQSEADSMVEAGLTTDAAEDAQFGAAHDGFSLPEALQTRQARLEALRHAKAELEQRARDKETERKQAWDQMTPKERPHRRTPNPETVVPEPKDRYNFVDPQSRLMKGRHQYVQGYNAQVSVDADHQVIVACGVTDDCTDYSSLIPLTEQTTRNVGQKPELTLADGGYFDYLNIRALEVQGYRLLIPPDNQWSRDLTVAPPLTDAEQAELTVRERMKHLVSTEQGRADYAGRLKTVEPVFGQIKGSPGHPLLTRFLRRGLEQTDEDWCLVCAAQNLRKLMRFRTKKNADKQTVQPQRRTKYAASLGQMALQGV